MATWESNPSVPHTGGTFTFPKNTGTTAKVYTITYTDDDGCTAQTTYTIPYGEECQPCTCENNIHQLIGVDGVVPIPAEGTDSTEKVIAEWDECITNMAITSIIDDGHDGGMFIEEPTLRPRITDDGKKLAYYVTKVCYETDREAKVTISGKTSSGVICNKEFIFKQGHKSPCASSLKNTGSISTPRNIVIRAKNNNNDFVTIINVAPVEPGQFESYDHERLSGYYVYDIQISDSGQSAYVRLKNGADEIFSGSLTGGVAPSTINNGPEVNCGIAFSIECS